MNAAARCERCLRPKATDADWKRDHGDCATGCEWCRARCWGQADCYIAADGIDGHRNALIDAAEAVVSTVTPRRIDEERVVGTLRDVLGKMRGQA